MWDRWFSALVFPAALGAATGASLVGMPALLGSDPGAQTWALALPILAAALSLALPWRPGRPLRLALLALSGAFVLAPTQLARVAATASSSLHLSPQQGLELFGLTWFLVLGAFLLASLPGRGRPATSAPGVALGACHVTAAFLLPTWLPVAGAALLSGTLCLRASADQSPSVAPPPLPSHRASLVAGLAAAAAAWGGSATWCTYRAWLDPTPWALACGLVASTLLFMLGAALARRLRHSGWSALLLATLGAATVTLLVPAGMAALPSRLPDLLQQAPAQLALPGLLGAAMAAPALFYGAAARISPRAVQAPAGACSIGAATGSLLGVETGLMSAPLLLLATGLLGGACLVVSSRTSTRLAGLAAALLAVAGWVQRPPLDATASTHGFFVSQRDEPTRQRHQQALERSSWIFAGWDSEGSIALRDLETRLVADVDGSPVLTTGRFASTLRFVGHLAPLLAPEGGRFLVLGDETGTATTQLVKHQPRIVQLSVAQPRLLRALAAHDEQLRSALLAPGAQLHSVPPGWLMLHAGPQEAILQLFPRPWPDAGSGFPVEDQLRLASHQLAPGGIYLAVIDLLSLEHAELISILDLFLDRFPGAWGWMPPEGADSLILVGASSSDRFDYQRLQPALASLPPGMDASPSRAPLDYADRCLFQRAGLAQLVSASEPRRRRPRLSLAPALQRPAASLLSGFTEVISSPAGCWELDDDAPEIAALDTRGEAAASLLSLLASSHSGDLQALFEQARELQTADMGSRELDTLIAPHLARARDHIGQSAKAGPRHPGWQAAANELTLAIMLHPKNLEARLMLAEVHEAQEEPAQAESLYRAVLEIEGDQLDALFGVARTRAQRGDPAGAEEMLRRATELHPRDCRSHQNLGVLLLQDARLDEAEASLLKASALAAEDASLSAEARAATNAALAELFLAQGRPMVARAEALQALQRSPSAYHHFLVGRCHYDLELPGPAERAFRQAVLIDPDFFPARGALGLIFAQRGDLEQAAAAFQIVLTQDPGNPAALRNLQAVQRLQAEDEATRSGEAFPVDPR